MVDATVYPSFPYIHEYMSFNAVHLLHHGIVLADAIVSLAAADFPPTLGALDTAPQPDLTVPYELPDDTDPALVIRQIVVELVSDTIELRQSGPRHGREIVVLVMQSDVVGEVVQHAVVAECLRDGDVFPVDTGGDFGRGLALDIRAVEDVVLCDEVAGAGVERAREEGGEYQVLEGLLAAGLDQHIVECYLHDDVEEVEVRQGKVEDEHRPQGIEKDLESGEEGFAED